MSKPIETNGTPDLAVECKQREQQCAELIEERDRLRAELAKVKSERDSYLKTVYYYLRKEAPPLTFTKEEVFAHLDDKPNVLDVIAEMVQRLEKRT
jgi:uncharacterized coiled-coil DUF342 family protein